MKEWKEIPDYEGYYRISTDGEIMRICNATNTYAGRVLKPCAATGYFRITLSKNNRKRDFAVHLLVLGAFIGPKPKGLVANHIDGNKLNNTLQNLEYVTVSENALHAIRTGLFISPGNPNPNRGMDNPSHKLTDGDVYEIMLRLQKGESTYAIAKRFGVVQGAISNIKSGRGWVHLTGGRRIGRARGIDSHPLKLNPEQIRIARESTKSIRALAKEFGVSRTAVSNAIQ